jgi:hypothetical protein
MSWEPPIVNAGTKVAYRDFPDKLQNALDILLEKGVQRKHMLFRKHGVTREILNDFGDQDHRLVNPRPSFFAGRLRS